VKINKLRGMFIHPSKMRAHVFRKRTSLKDPIKEPRRRTLLMYFCDVICTQRQINVFS